MVIGFVTGLLWYQFSGWGVSQFLYGIHPVWLGMSANILALVLLSLVTASDPWRLSDGAARYAGNGLLVAGTGLTVFAVQGFATLQPTGLLGLVLFLAALTVSSGLMALLRPGRAAVPARSGTLTHDPVARMLKDSPTHQEWKEAQNFPPTGSV